MFNFSIVVCCLSVLLWTHFSAYVFFELAVYFLISSLVGLSDFLCIDMYINRQRGGGASNVSDTQTPRARYYRTSIEASPADRLSTIYHRGSVGCNRLMIDR